MESLLIFLIVICLVINLGVIYYLAKSKSEVKENNLDQVFKDELSALKNTFSQSFGSMTKDIA